MGPAANAGRRPALVPEAAHVEGLARDVAALQHPQHRNERIELHGRKFEFVGRPEVLCKHGGLLLFDSKMIRACADAGNVCAHVRHGFVAFHAHGLRPRRSALFTRQRNNRGISPSLHRTGARGAVSSPERNWNP